MYARMVIGEAISTDQAQEFLRIYNSEVLPELEREPGFDSAHLMFEDGGAMAVSLTLWKTREQCLRYHSGRSYRQFVAKTQHLLAGSFVVKIFREGVRGADRLSTSSDTAGNRHCNGDGAESP